MKEYFTTIQMPSSPMNLHPRYGELQDAINVYPDTINKVIPAISLYENKQIRDAVSILVPRKDFSNELEQIKLSNMQYRFRSDDIDNI